MTPFASIEDLLEHGFRDRDRATGRLLLPLTREHLIGHLADLVYELGQRVTDLVPSPEVVARAIGARLQLFGHAPQLFGFRSTHALKTPHAPKVSHRDVCDWMIREAAAVCASKWLCALAGFDPGQDVEQMLPRFRRWWEPFDRRISAEREYQLASRVKPNDPITCLVYDVVIPTWRNDPPLDPASILAYKLESYQAFFAESPAAVKKHANEALNNMAAGVVADSRMRGHLARAIHRTLAGTEEAEAALLRKFAELAVKAETAAATGKPPVMLFGPIRLDPTGTPFVFIDRDGVAGINALRRELKKILKADRSAVSIDPSDVEAVRDHQRAAAEIREHRENADVVCRLRASFEIDGDTAALAFIDWKTGRAGSLKAAAASFKVGAKAIRHAEGRIAVRLATLRAG